MQKILTFDKEPQSVLLECTAHYFHFSYQQASYYISNICTRSNLGMNFRNCNICYHNCEGCKGGAVHSQFEEIDTK